MMLFFFLGGGLPIESIFRLRIECGYFVMGS